MSAAAPPLPELLFEELARVSERMSGTRSRLEKKAFLMELLTRVPAEQIASVVGWLVQEPLSGPLGVGPAHFWKHSDEASAKSVSHATVTLREVEEALRRDERGGRAETIARVEGLFARMTAAERTFFAGALTGSLRQGSLGGVMLLALAALAQKPEADVRRVVMIKGSIAAAADALLGANRSETVPTALELFHPVAPMLASHAESLEEGLAGLPDAEVEWKIDGVRAQIHKQGDRVAVYSRQGNDITSGCTPLLGAFRAFAADTTVLDAEVALVGPDGKARPFQDSFSTVASQGAVRGGDRLCAYAFDCLHVNGRDLLDEPLAARLEALGAIVPAELRVPRLRATSLAEAEAFRVAALAAGHEGVMVKDPASPYRFGARGGAWRKVKPFVTVDLVVLAVEPGSGRRKGWLSNLHLGARRADGTFCMVGKTFKGLTDAMLRWQTERLEQLTTHREGYVVHVRPELVVEIRFNDVQRSPRYPGGIALRFARVVRYREDKSAADIEPLEALVARSPGGGAKPAPAKRQLSLFGD